METLRQVSSIAAVFALLGLTLWVLRRGGMASFTKLRSPRGKSLEVVERLALGPHHAIHLVKIHGRELVVATHPRGCALLMQSGEKA